MKPSTPVAVPAFGVPSSPEEKSEPKWRIVKVLNNDHEIYRIYKRRTLLGLGWWSFLTTAYGSVENAHKELRKIIREDEFRPEIVHEQ